MKSLLSLFMVLSIPVFVQAQSPKNPSFEEVISLQSVYGAQISPDGLHVVFQKGTTDWENNRFHSELWLSRNGNEPVQLTSNPGKGSSSPQWSPMGEWIAFTSDRGSGTQLYVINAFGGEAMAITSVERGINGFEWSPDGKTIAFLQSEDKSKEQKSRKEKYGDFAIDDGEYSRSTLWTISFNPNALQSWPTPAQQADSLYQASRKPVLLLDSAAFTISNFQWSPDGTKIAINHQPDPLINTFFKADISILDVSSKSLSSLISNPSYDGLEHWSPDSKSILYSSSVGDSTSNYYKNGSLFRIDLNGKNQKQLGASFDEQLGNLYWTEEGIYGMVWQKTLRRPVAIDPRSGDVTVLAGGPERIWSYSTTTAGNAFAYHGSNDEGISEVYLAGPEFSSPKQLTNSSNQISDWAYANSEVISWESEDGTTIEGILHKPLDYDPGKKYPLLVAIHGGPTGISLPEPVPAYVYPIVQWLNKGALVLRPNYRGSAGYGESFRELNVRNLGVGDAWDVVSGVNYLNEQGLIDMDKVGAMGWSQGGYISAFLTTNTDMFKAISVGAGISNWMTYYVNTDIHPFTRQYLKATPWSDEEIYRKTSPMTNINNASTPTLIQHGEFDRRVPIANAYELVQGLRDNGVPSELIVYKGFGHGISKPKERLAAMWHNWQWFLKYIWGEEVELPE